MRRFFWIGVLASIFFIFVAGDGSAAPAPPSPPAILLAKVWRDALDPTAFWVSEKLDGVRAMWDGRTLRFRSGRPVHAPHWFVAGLPPQPLDGELWLGRGSFDALSAIVRKTEAVDTEWRHVRYMIFELPEASGTFGERVLQIRAITEQAHVSWLAAVPQFRVVDRAALMSRYADVIGHGGEGLMLHRADAPYRTGRSDDLLKLKPAQDAEAVIVGHVLGKGRLAGRLGALEVQTAEGRRFRVGSGLSAAERRNPPPIGATITYCYQELTKEGIPRFPRYWRLREEF